MNSKRLKFRLLSQQGLRQYIGCCFRRSVLLVTVNRVVVWFWSETTFELKEVSAQPRQSEERLEPTAVGLRCQPGAVCQCPIHFWHAVLSALVIRNKLGAVVYGATMKAT